MKLHRKCTTFDEAPLKLYTFDEASSKVFLTFILFFKIFTQTFFADPYRHFVFFGTSSKCFVKARRGISPFLQFIFIEAFLTDPYTYFERQSCGRGKHRIFVEYSTKCRIFVEYSTNGNLRWK